MIKEVFRSFFYAWRGILICFKAERSFRIQVAAGLCAVVAMLVFPLSRSERLFVIFVVMLVLVLELVNSSVERLVDLVKPRFAPQAGEIKDLMAGAVCVAAIGAFIFGIILFGPFSLDALRTL